MTDRPDYSDIIAKLESATGPILNVTPEWIGAMARGLGVTEWSDVIEFRIVNALQGSLDAALALVGERLPDAWWTMGSRSPWCNLWRGDNTCIGRGEHDTPPLAVLLAMFRALESGA